MTLFVQDGKALGHRTWLQEALERNLVQGAIISPFATPQESEPRRPSAMTIAQDARDRGGEVIFDSTTHALMMPGVTETDIYNTWDLWSGDPGDLSSPTLATDHVQRVFEVQRTLGAPLLVPTIPLAGATFDPNARTMLELAEIGATQGAEVWQSLAGQRAFWASGSTLDLFVGELAQLHAPVWVLTFVRDRGLYPPDSSDTDAIAGFARTVHSLSVRSRVVVAHSDFFGLISLAAGADAIGTGWHSGQRVFSSDSYIERSGGRNMRYVTHGTLLARLKPDVAELLDRANAALAYRWRDNNAFPLDDAAARAIHLQALGTRADEVKLGADQAGRVERLRALYDTAQGGWTRLMALLPGVVSQADTESWVGQLRAGLEQYAAAEGF